MKWLIAALALTGCDRLLDLRKVDPPLIDALVEGVPPPDSPIPCVPDGTHDEDNDRLPDNCDLCPTVNSTNLDMDGDGLGDECDPRSDANDKIDSFYPFVDRSGLKTAGGVTSKPDSFVLDNGTLETLNVFNGPEQVTVGVANLASAPTTATIVLSLNASGSTKASCEVVLIACPTGAAVCIFASQNGMSTNTPTTLIPAEVETLTLYRTDGVVRCGINDVTLFHSPQLQGPMPNGAVQVAVPIGPITVRNLIVYNTVP